MPAAQTATARERFHAPGGILCYMMPPISDENAAWMVGDLFGPEAIRARVPNPESPGGYISVVTREGVSIKEPEWLSKRRPELTRTVQMAFNHRVTRANEITASCNSGLAQFLAEFDPVATTFVTVGIHHPAA
jgi:hypothetical protein